MTQFKEGDKVDFEHVGRDLTGTVLEVLPDGKVRVKDERGYMYRYLPENVRMAGTPKPTEALNMDSSNSNTNNSNTQTMAKKKDAEKKPAPAAKNGNGKVEAEAKASNPALAEQAKKIAALECKKHQRIWLLHSLGLDKAEVMKYAKCNAGELSNARKDYGLKPEKVKAAEALLA